ncbi:hypothetical protein ASPBRDRAFT_374165 [Aspergillus brasiliensis CBS 101740]|uniref:BZIP domain-containing protein n=1 Tax=Aspergillus brasiliensis (strain CBS 101740 / IMI 381727 / IBT 21946) TaxID=767769 RepID=A0A1L9UV79_ASPBC|nr:hypothetical protein ASPBRDRAFT_374165 [Aspergillus brasiliensis CBS 101740]
MDSSQTPATPHFLRIQVHITPEPNNSLAPQALHYFTSTMNSFLDHSMTKIKERPCPSQRKRVQNRLAQRKFREKAKARKQSQSPDNQADTIDNGKSHSAQSNLTSSLIEPESHDNGYAYLTAGNYSDLSSAFTCSIPSFLAENVQQSNSYTLQEATVPVSESMKGMPYDMNLSIAEDELRVSRSHLPIEPDYSILFDPNIALFGNVRDGQQKQHPVDSDRHRSAINTCGCDCGHHDALKQAQQLVQNQRTKLFDQAEQLLEKVESLYDVGISLGVLVENHRLRDLLRRAMDGFRSQRDLETYNCDEEVAK